MIRSDEVANTWYFNYHIGGTRDHLDTIPGTASNPGTMPGTASNPGSIMRLPVGIVSENCLTDDGVNTEQCDVGVHGGKSDRPEGRGGTTAKKVA